MKKLTAFLLTLVLVIQFAACKAALEETSAADTGSETTSETSETQSEPAVIRTEEYGVIHEPEFGGIYITITIDDFNDQYDITYGDSVNVYFSNGAEFLDIPYYNGYYCKPGENLLVAYPGYDYIKVACNFGEDLFVTAGLSENDTAWIELNEEEKYLDNQIARDITYVDDRALYPTDQIFANFRSCNVGDLKQDILYRSASPCDNQHNRAAYVDALCREAGINYILDLADTDAKIQGYMSKPDYASEYFTMLYERGDVGPLGLSANYGSQDFKDKLTAGLVAMLDDDGPYLVNCTEGKDRTGLVIMIFEMLAGASYDEMLEDYMVTYFNYYGIAGFTDSNRYRLIKENLFDDMLRTAMGVKEDFPLEDVDFVPYAQNYLSDAGMTDTQIDMLRAKLVE